MKLFTSNIDSKTLTLLENKVDEFIELFINDCINDVDIEKKNFRKKHSQGSGLECYSGRYLMQGRTSGFYFRQFQKNGRIVYNIYLHVFLDYYNFRYLKPPRNIEEHKILIDMNMEILKRERKMKIEQLGLI